MNTNLQKSWEISLGLMPLPEDPRRISSKIIDDIDNKYLSQYDKFFSDPYFKRIRRGMAILLKNGINNGEEIYRILKSRKFAVDIDSGKIITPSTFGKYLRFVRKKVGIVKLSKKEHVFILKNEGLTDNDIAIKLNTNIKYIKEVISDAKLYKDLK